MDVATIKGVVDRLHKKGLVSVAPDESDRRRTTIRPTQAALDMIADLHAMGFHISDETLEPLNAEERQLLLKLLVKMT